MPLLPDRRRTRGRSSSCRVLIGALLLATALVAAWARARTARPRSRPARRPDACRHGSHSAVPGALKARLAELGWTDGKNIQLIWRNLEPDQAEEQAEEFVRERVDLIVAFEDTSIARRAGRDRADARPTGSRSSSCTRPTPSATAWSTASRIRAGT